MNERKATKRALLTSITALVMCVVMLAGTTFAWFTDTASTNVNKIQAGNLDVALEMLDGTNWVTAEGKTLEFKKAGAATSGEKVLWEPGAEYKLPELRVVNNGNLNIKYKVEVTGIQMNRQPVAGVFDLNDVITWKADGLTLGTEATLKPTESKAFTISGKMDTAAGNDYQGLTIDNVSITVYATQATGEYDSNGPDYDKDADMTPDNLDQMVSANVTETAVADAATVLENSDSTVVATVPANAVAAGTSLTLSVVPQSGNKGNVTLKSDDAYQAYDVKVSGLAEANTTSVEVKLFVGKNLQNVTLYHNSEPMTGSTYDPTSGVVTFSTTSFSPFTVVYDAPTMTVDGVAYYDLTNAVKAASEGSVITFVKSTTEPMKLTLANEMTIKDVTFKANSGVVIDGLQLASTNTTTRLTLDGIKFEGISFTDVVIIGQDSARYGLSQCTDITFDGCKFDLSTSTEKYPDAIKRMGGTVSGTISEKEAVAYMDGLTVKDCVFTNVRYGIYGGKVRNTTVESCTFTNCSSYAVRFEDVAGELNVIGNTVNKAGGVLSINTVGNNYSTTDIKTDVTIKNNKATDMTCGNGDVFMTNYDNARKSGKSNYTITGNSCTYTQSFDEPLNGFRIKRTYGPSVAEFIENK